MRKDFKSSAAAALSLAIVAAALAACSKGEQAGGGMHNMPPPQVSVVVVKPQSVPVTFEYTGQTLGSREVEVRARVGGIIEKRLYAEGGPVAAGQVLFELDPKPLQAQVAAAEADVATAEARAAQATRESARLKPLLAEKAVSQQEYDNAVSNAQIGEAGLLSSKARLQELRLNLGYTKVVAPVSGMSGRALKSEGSLVSTADSLLTTLVQLDPLYVSFGPSENEQNAIERDVANGSLVLPKISNIDVEIRGADGSVLAKGGRVNFTDSHVSSATGTVERRAELPNPGNRLKAGQFVRVALHGAVRPNAIVVPQGAVLEGPQSKIVMTVAKDKDGKDVVAPRPVEVGEWTTLEGVGGKPATKVWVITKGLAAGDQVILDNFVKLRPGAPVVPVSPEAAAAAQSAPAAPAEHK
ncbi:efflux RND transporter periplasmic adaptor subunit [Uliginosibacterium sp. H3]|uniref:Efflux RND transporter periplasmic adaptor subunit n=1 Tax=Uliginosibacterium silvisoli TaxID=3114758 RepID=A0ABU6K7J5_9RHOO|nr:efflux RND transporter periplasmic adaptor subunit [Uliginosibacterium sp. H3]